MGASVFEGLFSFILGIVTGFLIGLIVLIGVTRIGAARKDE